MATQKKKEKPIFRRAACRTTSTKKMDDRAFT
jgi:hypothetical protein